MSIKHPFHQAVLRGLSASVLVSVGIGMLPAAALAEQVIPPGSIIISRDVGPRNALTPEVGLRYSIPTAPDPADLAFAGQVTAITDEQASEISSSTSIVSAIGTTLQGPMDMLTGADGMNSASDSLLGQSGGGFIGETINGAIGDSMSALSGVFASLPTVAP